MLLLVDRILYNNTPTPFNNTLTLFFTLSQMHRLPSKYYWINSIIKYFVYIQTHPQIIHGTPNKCMGMWMFMRTLEILTTCVCVCVLMISYLCFWELLTLHNRTYFFKLLWCLCSFRYLVCVGFLQRVTTNFSNCVSASCLNCTCVCALLRQHASLSFFWREIWSHVENQTWL